MRSAPATPRRGAPADPEPERPPTLTLFCGLPGSGKTTLARRLETEGVGVRICTDDWQHELGADWADPEAHERLQAVLYRHALTLLRHRVDVILEDGLWMRDERLRVFTDARACGALISWHLLEADLDTLWHRLASRNAAAGLGAFPMTRADLEHAWDLFQPPADDEIATVDQAFRHRPDGTVQLL